jgi:hypothetical protein
VAIEQRVIKKFINEIIVSTRHPVQSNCHQNFHFGHPSVRVPSEATQSLAALEGFSEVIL